MIPSLARVRARSLEEFGDLVRHAGEEFVFVVKGAIAVHTEYYDAITLGEGQSIYLDSGMGHAYVVAEGCDEAITLAVMSSDEQNFLSSLMTMFDETKDAA